jgi:hypothetical protein
MTQRTLSFISKRPLRVLPRNPVKRAGPRLVGLPYEPDEAVAVAEPEPEAVPEKRKRGRPPKGDKAMTAAERQRRSRELEPLIREQKTDDATGGVHGPGKFMKDAPPGKGLLISGDDSIGPKIDTPISTGHSDTGSDAVRWDDEETDYTFQNSRKIHKNWKYDERDKQEMVRKKADRFIRPVVITEFSWDDQTKEFLRVRPLRWCAHCQQLIPDEMVCTVCQYTCGTRAGVVAHMMHAIAKPPDQLHLRRILKGMGRPEYIPKVEKLVRDLYKGIEDGAEAAARAAGWRKVNGKWVL